MDFDFNKGKDKLKNIYEGAIVFGKKLMKKSWFKYALVMFFILMILLGFSLGTISANRSYAISKLEMALRKGSARDVAKLVQVDNKKMKLSSDEVTPMLQYYREDQSRITDLINILKDDKGAYGLSIKHRKHWYGQEYYVVLELKDIDVKSNFQDSKVYLNDKYVGAIDENGVLKFQGLVPGTYNIKIENKNKYCKISKEDKINFVDSSSFEENLDGIKISVVSEFTQGEVYVNGVSTNVFVKDFKDIGPFPKNSQYRIRIKQDTPWGEIFSDEQVLKDIPILRFSIDLKNEDLTKSIEDQVSDFYKSVFEALNKEDKEIIKGTTEAVKDNIYNEMKKDYHFLKNDYNVSDLQINMGNSEVKYDKGLYNGNIVVNISYNISKKLLGFDLTKEKQEKSFFTKIQFLEGKWVVNEVDKFK